MSYLYDKSGQDVYFQREESYGKIYDPESSGITAWTAIPATYAHWRKLDYIPDTLEPIIPKIEKILQYDVGDGKHASSIAEGNIEETEFTISMDAQGLEFLMLAIGSPTYSSHGQAMTQTLSTVAKASLSDGDYFLLDVIDASNAVKHYLIWFDVTGGGSAPSGVIGIADGNRIEVDVSADTTATQVADRLETALEALAEITTADNVAEVMTIVHANNGAVLPAREGAATTGFTFHGPSTWGSTTYTVTEDLTDSIPSFTLHFEQRNTTAGENIIYDCFGCVVEEIVVNIGFGDKIVKYDITVKCPYAIEGNTATNSPGLKRIDFMPTMNSLKESASNYLIQEGTTDRTPETVDKVSFSIKNNVKFQSDINAQYKKRAIAGKREVSLNIVGSTSEKELFNYWHEKYKLSSGDWIPNSASGKLNTEFKLQRDATYDYLQISVYNWLLQEHNFVFSNVSDAVKSVDMKFIDGTGDSNGRILDSTTYVSYIDRNIMLGTK